MRKWRTARQSSEGSRRLRRSKRSRFAHVGGTTMSKELSRIDLTGPGASGGPEKLPFDLRPGLSGCRPALIACMGHGLWRPAMPASLAGAKQWRRRPSPGRHLRSARSGFSVSRTIRRAAGGEAIVPEATAPVDGLKISSQFWRRGGLGSKALVTFTLRNDQRLRRQGYRDLLRFSRRDGSHLTDRARVIHDTVNKRRPQDLCPPAYRLRQRQCQQGQMLADCRAPVRP